MTAKGATLASGFSALYSANSVLILTIHSSRTCCGLAFNAGNDPIIPALHCAITNSGPDIIKSGDPITGMERLSFNMTWNWQNITPLKIKNLLYIV